MLRKWTLPGILFAAHFVVHFSLPILDLILHGALFLSVVGASRNV